MNKELTVFVIATNSQGEPEILAYDRSVSENEYENEMHLSSAKQEADDDGYTVITAFDSMDLAGKQLLRKAPVYGDKERNLSEINVPGVDNFTEILQHRIKWYLREDNVPVKLDEFSVEHIENMIEEGYNQGELCILGNDGDTEFRGWWSIDKS